MMFFDERSLRRVIQQTKFSEGLRRNDFLRPDPRERAEEDGFWAVITARNITDKWKYSWERFKWDQNGMLPKEELKIKTDKTAGFGNFNAVEAFGSEHVVVGDLVWMFPNWSSNHLTFVYAPEIKIGRGSFSA